MSEHTPGPWTVEPMVRHADNAFYIKATPNGNNSEKDVAVVGPCLAQSTEANARLIAAAPELLEALCKAIKWLAITDDPRCEKDLHAAEAAIAKARP